MKKSLWTTNIALPHFDKLCHSTKTDVLIIGGGLCGILCAYFLKKRGVDCILAEANTIACGTTKNTTAKITAQHGLIYDKLIADMGFEKAQMYLNANLDALNEYQKLCTSIECDYEEAGAYTYSMTDRAKLEAEVKAVNSLGFDAKYVQKPDLPFETKGAVCFEKQAQFDPIKFISAISDGLNIFEHTFVRDISSSCAQTGAGEIFADKIIVCTHFPFVNRHGAYFLKLYQHRSYVSAVKNAGTVNGMYVDEDVNGLSFRTHGDLLLIGGGGHRTGKDGGTWSELDTFINKYYPNAEVEYQWSTQDCMSLDSVPYIGRYSHKTPNLFVASGFNKWGMSSSMAAAKILCDMVTDKHNDFESVFSPQRSIFKPQLLINSLEAVKNILSPTTIRCPHMGCALKWNKQEHSWDCPCHGSRFEEDGTLIDNPATNNAKISTKE